MEYFGKHTDEQKILDFLELLKNKKGLSSQDLVAKLNRVVEYYREGLMYEFDESEYPSTLEMMRSDVIKDES